MKFSELPFHYFIDPNERIFWGYLLSAALIAFVVVAWQTHHLPNVKAKKAYWLHPSAVLDYKYFVIMWFLKIAMIGPLVLSWQDVAIWTSLQLREYLDPIFGVRRSTIVLVYTATLFVASDFTRYWLHRALHASDFLWVFHKVHHSAEVLNPVTFYRIHPVESFLFGLRYALTAGVVTGLFITLFGAKVGGYQIMGANVFIVIFSLIGNNLRHSHIYWGFPKWLESLIISPAQHQLHHQYRYSRTNYGGALAIWDWLFGSLRRSRDTEKPVRFGIASSEMKNFDSLSKLLLTPVKEAFASITKRDKPPT